MGRMKDLAIDRENERKTMRIAETIHKIEFGYGSYTRRSCNFGIPDALVQWLYEVPCDFAYDENGLPLRRYATCPKDDADRLEAAFQALQLTEA